MSQMTRNWRNPKYKNTLQEIGVLQIFKAKLMAAWESYRIGKGQLNF